MSQFPRLPDPPALYSAEYMRRLLQTLVTIFNSLENFPAFRGSTLMLTSLQQTGVGLVAGEVFIDEGLLRIVEDDEVFFSLSPMVMDIGTVTVTT